MNVYGSYVKLSLITCGCTYNRARYSLIQSAPSTPLISMACPRYLPAVLLLVALLGNQGLSHPLGLHNTSSPPPLRIDNINISSEIIRPPCRLSYCYVPDGRGGCMLDLFCQVGVIAPPNNSEELSLHMKGKWVSTQQLAPCSNTDTPADHFRPCAVHRHSSSELSKPPAGHHFWRT